MSYLWDNHITERENSKPINITPEPLKLNKELKKKKKNKDFIVPHSYILPGSGLALGGLSV